MAAATTTAVAPGGPTTTGSGVCFNASNPTQQIPCTTPPPPPPPFIEKHLWTIILAAVCLCLAITCIIFSCWRSRAKAEVIEDRKVRAKERLERKFKRELDEKKRQHQIAQANAANAADY